MTGINARGQAMPGFDAYAPSGFLAWKSWSQAWQVMGASARVEAAMRMERPQGQAAAIRLVLRRRWAGGGFAVPPQGHGVGQVVSWRA